MTGQAAYPWEAPASGAAAALARQMGGPVPRLETARLVLRAPRLDDFPAYAAILMSDRARHMGGPFSRQDAWLDFTQYVAGWQLRGAGIWTAELRASGDIAGFFSAGMEYGDREHELGYLLSGACEGQGLAAEAIAAVRDFALSGLELPSLVSYVDPGNTRSARAAVRSGARRDTGAEAAFDAPVLVYRHTFDGVRGMEAPT
ncbi:GNAT family N-acetyltransferase [Cribrihabitans neustonicus]|uniref:GNAT family N-acetyltransferase n=1 Tax=Cribrihabitans neustonicus TaxID=1429085 RepID=UPI003B5C5947